MTRDIEWPFDSTLSMLLPGCCVVVAVGIADCIGGVFVGSCLGLFFL